MTIINIAIPSSQYSQTTYTAQPGDVFNIPAGMRGNIVINGDADFTVNFLGEPDSGSTFGSLTFGSNTEPTVNIPAGVDVSRYDIDGNGDNLTVNIGDGATVGSIEGSGLRSTGTMTIDAGNDVTVEGKVTNFGGADGVINFGSGATISGDVHASSRGSADITFGDDATLGGNLTGASGYGPNQTTNITIGDNLYLTRQLVSNHYAGEKNIKIGDNATIGNALNLGGGDDAPVNLTIGDNVKMTGVINLGYGDDTVVVGDNWDLANINMLLGDDELSLGMQAENSGSTVLDGGNPNGYDVDGITIRARPDQVQAFIDAGYIDNGDGTFSAPPAAFNGSPLVAPGLRINDFEGPATPISVANIRVANNDVMTVSESETFGDADLLDTGEASVLANDTQNNGAYTDVVGSLNGALGNVNTFVAGSNGGLLKVNADGSVDFDANGEFEALTAGQTVQTTFTYTLISGEEATVTVNVNGETDYATANDVLTVMESETSGNQETLDDGSTSILTNDTQDGAAYGGDVEMVAGTAANVGMQVSGSHGGWATINADGSIDFDANDEFDYLADGETATTTFSYEIAGGETANITVNVLGEDDATSGGDVLNLAIMLSSSMSMYASAQGTVIGVPKYPDVNGDGIDNQLIDMAYLMLNDFMSDAFDVAAAAGVTFNVSLISFEGADTGEGDAYWTVNDAASWDGQLEAKVNADHTSDYGEGFDNANAWFDTVSTANSTNAVFVIGDGFSTSGWATEHADLIADHGAEIDTYFPDLDIGAAAGVNAMNLMDKDGFSDMVFTDDAGLAGLAGTLSALDILDINTLIA